MLNHFQVSAKILLKLSLFSVFNVDRSHNLTRDSLTRLT